MKRSFRRFSAIFVEGHLMLTMFAVNMALKLFDPRAPRFPAKWFRDCR